MTEATVDFQAVEQIEKILEQILQSGVHELDLLKQLYLFRAGMPHIQLHAACSVENGTIYRFSDEDGKQEIGRQKIAKQDAEKQNPEKQNEVKKYIELANAAIAAGRVTKFVPASGAATRMFKSLLSVLSVHDDITFEILNERAGKQSDYKFTLHFITNIRSFAFFDSLKTVLAKDGYDIERLLLEQQYSRVLQYVVHDCGLGYAQLPKGLIEFHAYRGGDGSKVRTAFAEHLAEALDYAIDSNGIARVHFTISPEYVEKVQEHFSQVRRAFEKTGRLEITLSVQKTSTNTIAVTPENEPFLTDDGLHFRPAGHGALLENLNDLHADIAVLKNIDNVVPDRLKPTTFRYKRILCGLLVETQEQIFRYLRELESDAVAETVIVEIIAFAAKRLAWKPHEQFSEFSTEQRRSELFALLNRPLRVCGMVKNSGEPGGGPFIVRHSDGSQTLQIVESAQINLADPTQKAIFESSTHFNPVDLVCGVRDYKGQQFNLLDFRDDETGFISVKSSNGRELKALELPGLWNGSMAHWNTIFVEVPGDTFQPVKTINDLLKLEHQP